MFPNCGESHCCRQEKSRGGSEDSVSKINRLIRNVPKLVEFRGLCQSRMRVWSRPPRKILLDQSVFELSTREAEMKKRVKTECNYLFYNFCVIVPFLSVITANVQCLRYEGFQAKPLFWEINENLLAIFKNYLSAESLHLILEYAIITRTKQLLFSCFTHTHTSARSHRSKHQEFTYSYVLSHFTLYLYLVAIKIKIHANLL